MRMNKEVRAMLADPEGYAAIIRERVQKRKTRNVWWHIKPAERIYCQVRNATGDDWLAFDTAFPSEVGISYAAKKKRIYRLNTAPKVQMYTMELIAAFESKTKGKYLDLKERVVDMIFASLEARTANDSTAIHHCCAEVRMLAKILGWLPSTAHGRSDHNKPTNPQALTDEEILAYRRMRLINRAKHGRRKYAT